MVSAAIPTVSCVVCGSLKWAACRPGTAGDAQRWLDIFEIKQDEETPMVAWCEAHEPLRRAPKPVRRCRCLIDLG